jgi:hypothetical protein
LFWARAGNGTLSAKCVEYCVRVQLEQPEEEVVLPGDGDSQVSDRRGREVFEVLSDQYVCAACDRRGQHVPVLRVIGHGADQALVAGDPRVWEVGRHLRQAVLDGLLLRPGLDQIAAELG